MDASLWALFGSSFLASTLLPGGSEAVLAGLSATEAATPGILLMVATAGNTLGGMTSWAIGRWLRHRYPSTSLTRPGTERALRWLERWGGPVLLLSWLPVIGDPLCVAAGWLRVSAWQASLFIAFGKGARYALLLIGIEALR